MRAELPTGTWWIRGKGKVYCYNQPGGGAEEAREAGDGQMDERPGGNGRRTVMTETAKLISILQN